MKKSSLAVLIVLFASSCSFAESNKVYTNKDVYVDDEIVYSNVTKNGKTAYRLGTPSRKMVAAAYAMAGAEAFSRA